MEAEAKAPERQQRNWSEQDGPIPTAGLAAEVGKVKGLSVPPRDEQEREASKKLLLEESKTRLKPATLEEHGKPADQESLQESIERRNDW